MNNEDNRQTPGDRPHAHAFCAGLSKKAVRALLTGDRPSAYRLLGPNIGRVPSGHGQGARLPRTLVIPPGRYRVHGQTYTLNREGLYRFLYPQQENQQRIVYRRDIHALLSGLCWIVTHGNRDDRLPLPQVTRLALTRKVIRTCGPYSTYCCYLLGALGIPAREISTLSLDALNSYDRGHELMEVRMNNRWVLVDIDMHRIFRSRGRLLNAQEAQVCFKTGDYEMERLAASVPLAIGYFSAGRYDYDMWAEGMIATEGSVRQWYRRITALIIVRDADHRAWYTTPYPRRRAEAERYYPHLRERFLAPGAFREQFYRGLPF